MAFFGDYHTHTVFSHGKGTIEENVRSAIDKGLKEIAITDHGFRHMTYNVRRKDFPKMREIVDDLNQKFPQIKVYLGLETNLTSTTGKADIKEEDIQNMDIVICGYHKLVLSDKPKDIFSFFLANLLRGENKNGKKRIARNTDAYIKMIERYDVDIVSHINYGIASDAVEVARACKHFGTYVELNGKRINMTDAEIEKMAQEGVQFICDSDAHSVDRIGDFSTPQSVIDRLHLPYELIANWEKLPNFRSRIKKGL